MKKKGLIICPYLSNFGGTELETVLTIKEFLEHKLLDEVHVFSPEPAGVYFRELLKNENVKFKQYPTVFLGKKFQRIEHGLNKLFFFKTSYFGILKLVYWKLFFYFDSYTLLYVITRSSEVYFLPIIFNGSLNKTIIKFTTVYNYLKWDKFKINTLKKCAALIVTSKKQESFIREEAGVLNIQTTDVFVWNEEKLLEYNPERGARNTFGMLCRISKEKQIEIAVDLVERLLCKGIVCELQIRGPVSDKNYYDILLKKISGKKLEGYVKIDTNVLSPLESYTFYRSIDYFLITSLIEGGPNTGLEAMAAGIPVLSFDVGAMRERFAVFENKFIAENFDDLVSKAIEMLNLTDTEYADFSTDIKSIYKNKFVNAMKFQETIEKL